ncbi:YgfZ/GcvT domain-containing protein [Beggiatoa leptomitoformis]|uniref:Folate-binding protein n=1 Tax=Beggiatoa leptomitoformis TaxID=288004 RepID=A0A2N9YBZ6_9GAMM|nr:folate-binding protein YgfZ [Beggiatoa leptomitoformis]ALG66664.1 folate-binding protein [Beggiatoa leptomitoformis]AUI68015.1 folate-binding protein [Beggiatoa leptomitoformis]
MEQWTQFLQQAGAHIEARTVLDFGQAAVEQQAVLQSDCILDLSTLGLLQVTGNDAEKFLQGQFTNDVRQVNGQRSQRSAWCNAKGRVLYTFQLIKRDNTYLILLPHEVLDAVQKRLKMFVLRSDVQFTDVSDQLPPIGVVGKNSQQLLANALGFSVPEETNASITQEQTTIVRIAGQIPRYIVISDLTTQSQTWQALQKHAKPVGTHAWQLLDILAGIPQIATVLSDEFIPQMLNYQAIGGINFKKGCYAGQEIVARMQYLATLKQRLYLVKIANSSTTPQAGDNLYGTADTQSIGKLVNIQAHPEGGYVGLAVLNIEQADSNPVYLQQTNGTVLDLLELPYDPTATMAA